MTSVNWWATAAAMVLAVVAGYLWADRGWQAKWSDYQASATAQSQAELSKAWASERRWQALADKAAQDARASYEEIEEKYKAALAELNSLNAERVRSADAARDKPMSSTAGTACRPCRACPSQRAGSYVRADRALEIARDCDMTASRYNRLLRLYQNLQAKN